MVIIPLNAYIAIPAMIGPPFHFSSAFFAHPENVFLRHNSNRIIFFQGYLGVGKCDKKIRSALQNTNSISKNNYRVIFEIGADGVTEKIGHDREEGKSWQEAQIYLWRKVQSGPSEIINEPRRNKTISLPYLGRSGLMFNSITFDYYSGYSSLLVVEGSEVRGMGSYYCDIWLR